MVSNTKSMSRNLSIIGISILVLFIAIIIAAIVVTKSFRPPTDIATEDRVKSTKVGMIYQTKKVEMNGLWIPIN
jgi:ABC-type transporter Mla subunit MlaD